MLFGRVVADSYPGKCRPLLRQARSIAGLQSLFLKELPRLRVDLIRNHIVVVVVVGNQVHLDVESVGRIEPSRSFHLVNRKERIAMGGARSYARTS